MDGANKSQVINQCVFMDEYGRLRNGDGADNRVEPTTFALRMRCLTN